MDNATAVGATVTARGRRPDCTRVAGSIVVENETETRFILVTSAAVNPSLTIAAMALRSAAYLIQ